MSDVKRYDPMGYMAETPYGDYVSLNDYDQLKVANYLQEIRLKDSADAIDQLKIENERLSNKLASASWLYERDTLRKQLDEANAALGAKNARIHEYAERHLVDFAELERLDKQLDEARWMLNYIKTDCTLSMLHRIDAWLERNKE